MSKSTIYQIFHNKFYAGMLSYQKEWRPGKHKPMVTLDEFDRVQELLAKHGNTRPQKNEFAFTGFIRCGECGCLCTAETKKRRTKASGEIKRYTYYHCTWKRTDIRCSQRKNVTEEDLTAQIERELANLTILPEFRAWALESLGKEHEKEVSKRSTIYESLQKTLADSQGQLDNLTRLRVREQIDDEQYTRERDRLKEEIAKLKGEVEKTGNRAGKDPILRTLFLVSAG